MSTRGRIGLKLSDGKIKSIYVHYDSYEEGVGKMLKEHYNDPKKIEELLNLGDISVLGTFYDEELAKENWEKQYDREWRESERGKRASEMTLPYKDRGETEVEARIDENEQEYIAKAGKCWEDYIYLYKEDYNGVYRWHIMETPYFKALEVK